MRSERPRSVGGRGREETSIRGALSTRDKLLQAGRSLFARGGFHGTSVRELAREAGVSPASVTYHFSSKAEFYRVVTGQAIAPFLTRLDPPSPAEMFDGHPLALRLAEVVRELRADPELERLLSRWALDFLETKDGSERERWVAEFLLVAALNHRLGDLLADRDEASPGRRGGSSMELVPLIGLLDSRIRISRKEEQCSEHD